MYQSKQEIFDIVVERMLTQNEKSQDENGLCMYRQGNLVCGFGALIPDEVYHPDMENATAHYLMRHVPRISALFAAVDFDLIEFVQELQDVHDMNNPPNWAKQFRLLASRHELNPEVLGKFQQEEDQ